MATPAKERLDKLFSRKPLPPKPDIPTLIQGQAKPENKSMMPEMESTTTSSAQYPGTANYPFQQSTTNKEIVSSSDEEDDYVALFKKPKTKASQNRPKYKPEPGVLNPAKTEHTEALGLIKCLPQGKVSGNERNDNKAPSREDEFDHSNAEYEILGQFCLFSLVAKFPYKYMEDANDRVSKSFFAGGKIYSRVWDMYYLHMPESFGAGPIILVPFGQVKQLLSEISSTFKIETSVPPFPFTLSFYDDETPQPVLLGTSHSRQEMNDLQNKIPDPAPNFGECPSNASHNVNLSFRKWYEKCTKAQQANKKTKSNSKKKNGKAQLSLQEKCDQLKRAQRYLGLRPRLKSIDDIKGLSWDQREDLIQEQLNQRLTVEFLKVEEVAPYNFDGQPVIIGIDVESYERNHSLITEVGISSLDTMDLVNVSPGKSGENWTKLIRSRHFLINGRENLVNHEFVQGCPGSFHFGVSERVDLDRVAGMVDSCFEWPFSVQYKHDGKFRSETLDAITHRREEIVVQEGLLPSQKGSKQRNIILLGHDTEGDITYLSKLGSNIFGPSEISPSNSMQTCRHRVLASILEVLDTAVLFQTMTSEVQPRSLGSLCNYLDITPWHLHNAGNDARYTLESLIKIVIKSRQIQDEVAMKLDPESTACTEDHLETERTRMIDERMTQAQRNLKEEIKNLEEARAQGTASPKLISSIFQRSMPVLVKKSVQPAQASIDRDEAIRLWTAAQEHGEASKW